MVIRWQGSVDNARISSNSSLNQKLRNGRISNCEKVIVESRTAAPICILGDAAYSFILHNFCEFKKENVNAKLIEAALKYNKEFKVNKSIYIYSKPYIPILLTVCNNISIKNVIKCVKSVKLLNVKLLLNVKRNGTLTIVEIL